MGGGGEGEWHENTITLYIIFKNVCVGRGGGLQPGPDQTTIHGSVRYLIQFENRVTIQK